ncbi:ABC transporter substrate-binding protein [Georgenia thermotolerans]|uniref:Sugar ABC transporter substrate-binding protein n=1 Tax=Georgenia thermotolerans TaxID=527326 RepID=A0A7J5USL4_9MICO|nr:ABC transporter substrate-binding protein [Georgenia thermotolerans]KAE8765260.1 sugar ABC transporter substrate-binding protein [Georgenia thermotolerans]
MKRSTTSILTAALAATALTLSACSSGSKADTDAAGGKQDAVEIGITQIVSHTSLDAAREGFKKALAENGYVEGENVTYDEKNAQGDQATATSIANKFASDGKDLVLAIATPTAQAAAQAITDIPILITAVTEPAEAGLVDSWEAPGGNITGTSDLNAVEEQLSLVKELAPEAKTVGVVYSSGEVNSQVQVDLAEEAAKKLGLTLKLSTITASGEVQQAANSLDVDAFYVPTDNNVVSALDAVLQVAETKQVPVIVGEGDSVANGGVATYGFDYEQLGYQTGLMAVKILKDGADPAEMPVEKPTDLQLYVNPAAAERMGVTIPQKLLDSADVTVEE